jgi:hypothetical protein
MFHIFLLLKKKACGIPGTLSLIFSHWAKFDGPSANREATPVPGLAILEQIRYNFTSMSIIVEIRAAEGGDDAKLLVQEQMAIYLRLGGRRCL